MFVCVSVNVHVVIDALLFILCSMCVCVCVVAVKSGACVKKRKHYTERIKQFILTLHYVFY